MKIPTWNVHADQAKKRHGISEKQIALTWVHGMAEPTRDGCWRIIGEEITLVTNPAGNFIITMYPNKYRDRFTERIARARRFLGTVRKEMS